MYIEIKNVFGDSTTFELSEDICVFFKSQTRIDKNEAIRNRKHIDSHSIDDYIVSSKLVTETLETTFFRKEQLRNIIEIINTCTPIQRKRVELHFICGYTISEIADMERCSPQSVSKSIKAVQKKIMKYLNK